MQAKITGTGYYVPGKPIPNIIFNEKYGMDIDKFLREKRNIYTRHYMDPNQATSDLALRAAQKALASAQLTPDDINLIILATDTPDYLSPSTASVIQFKLNAKNAATFDVNTACAGFVTALDMAGKYIKAEGERYKNILVIGAYGMSKFINWDDYKIATLFADGAGAVVVTATEEKNVGILASELFSDGQYHDYMGVFGGGTFMPINEDVLHKKAHLLNFAKKIPIETNGTYWPMLVNKLLNQTGIKKEEVARYFFTQINIDSINETMDRLEVDRKLSYNIMDRFGYTGSACIPMALADAAEKNLLKKGDVIMLVGSGGGLSMASVCLRW
ncbi:MAG: ketoacyl-ACP synthase III [Oligoflexia bacterium]|nr:ketoacyl-ACP synthase III [Oligoflexia bacterium]